MSIWLSTHKRVFSSFCLTHDSIHHKWWGASVSNLSRSVWWSKLASVYVGIRLLMRGTCCKIWTKTWLIMVFWWHWKSSNETITIKHNFHRCSLWIPFWKISHCLSIVDRNIKKCRMMNINVYRMCACK